LQDLFFGAVKTNYELSKKIGAPSKRKGLGAPAAGIPSPSL
jgi:hypothetical protein